MLSEDVDHKVGTGKVVDLQLQVHSLPKGQGDQCYHITQTTGVCSLLSDLDLVERRSSEE